MATIGVRCQFCDRIFPINIVGLSVTDITEDIVDQVLEKFVERHSPTHEKQLIHETEEALAHGD